VRNVQKTPQIRLSIGGETFEGRARFLADRAEHKRAMAAIRRKYWMYVPIVALGPGSDRHGRDARQHRIVRNHAGWYLAHR